MRALVNYEDSRSLGSRFRARRAAPLIRLLRSVKESRGSVSILDLGGRKTYWRVVPRVVLEECCAKITILNLPAELKPEDDEIFTHAEGDACNLIQYSENAFDIVHSNSVIEHVGNWENMTRFAREARRVAPYHFIQTPYFWFPIEPHYILPLYHWLPRPLRVAIFLRRPMGHSRIRVKDRSEAVRRVEDDPILLDLKMFRSLFPDSVVLKERILLLTKSMIALRTP